MDMLENFKQQAPQIVKSNKGALIGAAVGYFFLSGDKNAQSAMLGAVVGSLFVDKKAPTETTVKETTVKTETEQ